MSVCSFIPVTLQREEELASPAKLQSSLFVGGFRGLIWEEGGLG